ncbi:MAG TPA: hypothetical protein VI413_06750 [Paludibacter sp.]
MKTSTLKSLIVTLAIILSSSQAFAQNMVDTRIDVKGSRYTDQMWVFAVSTCTRDFDNGWDAYKMFGSVVTPQLFAWEANGNFQIDAVPDFNNTYLGFRAGEDSVYTFTFNHEYVDQMYTQLYLIDSVANKTVNIFASGTQYTFTVQKTDMPVKRFKIVTSLPTPPVVVAPTDPVVVVTPDTVVAPTEPVVTPVDNKGKKDKVKKIKVYNVDKTLVVDNTGKEKGMLKLYNAVTGKLVKTVSFNATAVTRIPTELKSGSYVVYANTSTEDVTTTVVIR